MTTAAPVPISRLQRRRLIADLIRGGGVVSQDELVDRLAADGLRITQATVSRDLTEIGAVKVRRGSGFAYALPGDVGGAELPEARLRKVFSEWVESLEAAGNLIVIRTPPGSAHVVGNALDQSPRPDIAGCIAGDDTVMVIVRDGHLVTEVLHKLRALAG
jgi:transcriptional regulator of arginine metabolism